MRLIAFNGGYGSGKSTAIRILKEEYSPFKITTTVKFAEVLYEMQEVLYKMIEPVYYRPDDFIKDRKLLQFLGTEFGRSLDKNLWVKLWIDKVKSFPNHYTIVCDDCRFDNEAEAVKALGGVIIRIDRPDNGAHAQGGTGITNHASEQGINPALIDYTIVNNGTLEEFKDSLCKVLEQIWNAEAK